MFSRDFNELLNDILTMYRNADPIEQLDVELLRDERPDIYAQYLRQTSPDLSVGSILYMRAACTASIWWSMLKNIDKMVDQVFPSTAHRRYLEIHAADHGILTVGKTDAAVVAEISEVKRRRSACNAEAYEAWARSVKLENEHVVYAKAYPLAQGDGTVDMVIVGSNDRGVPSQELLGAVYNYIGIKRPPASGNYRVLSPVFLFQNVVVLGVGDFDRDRTKSDIEAYVDNLYPGQVLYKDQITSLAINNGAQSATVQTPATNIIPTVDGASGTYQILRFGNVSVS